MKRIEVSAAVIRSGGRVFAVQRGHGEFGGLWEFPGGKIEEGERPEETIVREILEELGAKIEVEEKICDCEWDYPDFHLTMHCFLCRLREGESPVLKEHSDSRWLLPREFSSVRWLPADGSVLGKVSEILEKVRRHDMPKPPLHSV